MLPVEIWAYIATYGADVLGRLLLTIHGLAKYMNEHHMLDEDSPIIRGYVTTVYDSNAKMEVIRGSDDRPWLKHGKYYLANTIYNFRFGKLHGVAYRDDNPYKEWDNGKLLWHQHRNYVRLPNGILFAYPWTYECQGFVPIGTRISGTHAMIYTVRENQLADVFASTAYEFPVDKQHKARCISVNISGEYGKKCCRSNTQWTRIGIDNNGFTFVAANGYQISVSNTIRIYRVTKDFRVSITGKTFSVYMSAMNFTFEVKSVRRNGRNIRITGSQGELFSYRESDAINVYARASNGQAHIKRVGSHYIYNSIRADQIDQTMRTDRHEQFAWRRGSLEHKVTYRRRPATDEIPERCDRYYYCKRRDCNSLIIEDAKYYIYIDKLDKNIERVSINGRMRGKDRDEFFIDGRLVDAPADIL